MNRRLLAARQGGGARSLLLRPLRGRDRPRDDQGRRRGRRPNRQLVHRRPLALRPLHAAFRSGLRLVGHDRPRLASPLPRRSATSAPSSPSGPATATPTTGRAGSSSTTSPSSAGRYGERPATVERLRAEGFDVRCWGFGWPAGPDRARRDGPRVRGEPHQPEPLGGLLAAAGHPHPDRGRWFDGRRTEPRKSQIKGRTFEVPGSGGFLLTDRVPHLEDYLTPGREIGAFSSTDDLVDQVGWWLDHEQERAASGGSRISPRARRAHLRSSLRGDLRPHRTRRTTFSGRQRRT